MRIRSLQDCFYFFRSALEKTASASPAGAPGSNSGSLLHLHRRFHWIRAALFEKRLGRIVGHLVQEADK